MPNTIEPESYLRACLRLGLSLAALAFILSLHAAAQPYEETWESLAKHNEAPAWFQDAKFGIYFHWGPYSVPEYDYEWYGAMLYDNDEINNGHDTYQHHLDNYGSPLEYGYDQLIDDFKAEKFDPQQWAELFKQAGAQFAGPVAEHHDGFAMWNSKVTPWNAKQKGPKRDIVGEIAEAVRARDMKLVTTFHHARNHFWSLPPGGSPHAFQNLRTFDGYYSAVFENYPTLLRDRPELGTLFGWMPRDKFLDQWERKLREVINNYQPDIIWFDSFLDRIDDKHRMKFLAHYFNSAEKWGKEVVVTCKYRQLPRNIAVEDFEKGRANKLTEYVWLTDDTISHRSWSYTKGQKYKSSQQLVHNLVDIASKNGVLLLNICPRGDGSIPKNQRQRLLRLGKWLDQHGEAIYATRPWVLFGEGPTRIEKGGAFMRFSGKYSARDIRYTTKENSVYATFLGWPGNNKTVTLESFASTKIGDDLQVESVGLLGVAGELPWERDGQGLHVTLPDEAPDDLAVVLKIETRGTAQLLAN